MCDGCQIHHDLLRYIFVPWSGYGIRHTRTIIRTATNCPDNYCAMTKIMFARTFIISSLSCCRSFSVCTANLRGSADTSQDRHMQEFTIGSKHRESDMRYFNAVMSLPKAERLLSNMKSKSPENELILSNSTGLPAATVRCYVLQ